NGMLAEGMGQRSFTTRLPRLRQSGGTLEELPIRVNDGDQCDRRLEDAGRQTREPIERLLRRGVEESGALNCGQPIQVTNYGQQVRHRWIISRLRIPYP